MTNEKNDHDLLIELNTKVDNIVEGLKIMDKMETRLRDLEIARNGDVSKFNSDMDTAKQEINRLRNSNTAYSIVSGLLTVIGFVAIYIIK